MVTAFLNLLFPPRCCYCRAFLKAGERMTCAACEPSLPTTGADAVSNRGGILCISPIYYEGMVRESIRRLKFYSAPGYSKAFAKRMVECFRAHCEEEFDLITWIPLSRRRLRERGYNQARLLARAVSPELKLTAISTLLKIRDTAAQSSLSGEDARRKNVEGAYALKRSANVAGKRILLVDDVLTTGATLAECTGVLLNAGAVSVSGLMFAKVKRKGK